MNKEQIEKDFDAFEKWKEDLKYRKCKNCQFSTFEKGDSIITCGNHIMNFTSDSSCQSHKIRM